jgi:hypothetical protein
MGPVHESIDEILYGCSWGVIIMAMGLSVSGMPRGLDKLLLLGRLTLYCVVSPLLKLSLIQDGGSFSSSRF